MQLYHTTTVEIIDLIPKFVIAHAQRQNIYRAIVSKRLAQSRFPVIIHSFIHSFIQTISIAPLQAHYYSEALPTQHVLEFHAEAHRQL